MGKWTLIKGQHLKESAKGTLVHTLSVLRHCHWMVKVVVGIIPRFRLTEEALSSMLADVAFSHGAAYIDVEAPTFGRRRVCQRDAGGARRPTRQGEKWR